MKERRFVASLTILFAATACRTSKEAPEPSQRKVALEFFESAVPQSPPLVRINKAIADSQFSKLRSSTPLGPNTTPTAEQLAKLIRAARLAGRPSQEINSYAQILLAQKPVPKTGEWRSKAILELAHDAVRQKKLDLATYYLTKIQSEKSTSIQSESQLISGIISYIRLDYDQSIRQWNDAVRLNPDNRAARINLGYIMLRSGNAAASKELFYPIREHWLALSGLAVSYRLLGETKNASESCELILKSEPNYGPALINCALFADQNKKDKLNAETLLDRAILLIKRPDVSEYAFLLKNELKTRVTISSPRKPVNVEDEDSQQEP